MPKLTDRFLAALSVDKDRKDRLVFDTVSPGLGVRVTAKGTRTFIVQCRGQTGRAAGCSTMRPPARQVIRPRPSTPVRAWNRRRYFRS